MSTIIEAIGKIEQAIGRRLSDDTESNAQTIVDATRTDPPVSEAQRRAMWAAASGNSTLGIPKAVGKEFVGADARGPDFKAAEHFQSGDGVRIKSTGKSGRIASLTGFGEWARVELSGGETKTVRTSDLVKTRAFNAADSATPVRSDAITGAEPEITRGAGVLFVTPDNSALFLKRAPQSDHPGEWCFPGGTVEEGEAPEETARREVEEEIGFYPPGEPVLLCSTVAPQSAPVGDPMPTNAAPIPSVLFTNFVQQVAERFEPTVNGEHTGYAWAPLDQPPEPLHPGCRTAIARLTANELDVARMIRDGVLASPQRFKNVWLFAIRITGTGAAYRVALKEFVWRDPAHYMTDEFLARCNGLPVIWEHPKKKGTLDSKEFENRVVGAVMLPYLLHESNEVWGIARVYDDGAAKEMLDNQLSTSPAVVFRDPLGGTALELDGGSKLLIEDDPSLLDHVAICSLGVWDKGGGPAGVRSDAAHGEHSMTEEEKRALEAKDRKDAEDKEKAEKEDKARKDAEAKAKADAEGMDKMLKGIDALCSGMADVQKRMDAFESREKDREDKTRRDAMSVEEREKADKARKDAEEGERVAAEAKSRKDAADEKEKKEREEADALKARVDSIEARVPPPHKDDEIKELSDAQARADSVAHAFGKSAPRFLPGETTLAYRARLAGAFKQHSKAWAGVDLAKLDASLMGIAESAIFADAMVAANMAADVPAGQLREIRTPDGSGRMISTFKGPQSFIAGMKRASLRVTDIVVPQQRG